MHVRFNPFRYATGATVVGLCILASCSGGAGGSTGGAQVFNCAAGNDVLCLEACNLGCSDTGCQRTDIAQNEIIILQFSQPVDPLSVNSSSIRFRTAAGDQPVGEFFVNGNQVEFVPTLAISGGETFFGFAANVAYTMTIPGNSAESVRSTSGKRFAKTLSCSLRSTRGIVDLNNSAPRATLITPTPSQLEQAPLDLDIVLEFNELIDATPFLGSAGPVEFKVRRTRDTTDPTDGIARECDPQSQLVPLAGTSDVVFDPARQVSIVTFRPSQPLQPNVCIEITVTSAVTDLSGRSAQAQQFSFETQTVELAEQPVVEEFTTQQFFDEDGSAATWGNGVATFAQIGGDGRHGTFKVAPTNDGSNYPGVNWIGLEGGKQTYVFNLNSITIPAANTTTGSAITVTDGKFFFDKMIVPADTRLRFTGSVPPVFTVAGRLEVLGDIDIAGRSIALAPSFVDVNGQAGAAGGIFAGSGGKGGDRSPGIGLVSVTACSGTNGQDARVPGGHSYSTTVANTGGRGSQLFPASGLNTDLLYPTPLPTLAYTPSCAAGGGGGGMLQAGLDGRVITNNHLNPALTPPAPPLPAAMGPSAPGGAALGFLLAPTAADLQQSSLHFLVGGSGGGGAGSQACLTPHTNRKWVVGGGGGGGGGAIALRAGDAVRIGGAAKILANGGSTPNSTGATTFSQPIAGGGGSGGSIVLQSGRDVEVTGLLDVRGGNGGLYNRSANGAPSSTPPSGPPNGATVQTTGGAGSPGFVRLEAPGVPTTSMIGSMQPPPVAANVGTLVEQDTLVSLRSDFYSTGLVFGPDWVRYEIYANFNGTPMVFSDDPAVSTLAAGIGQPIRALFQPATIDLQSGAVLETRNWVAGVRTTPQVVGLQSAGLNGFRFALILDRAVAPAGPVTIEKVVVVYRN